jgi:hypothetical protein
MSRGEIPALHKAIAGAAVKALLGDRARIRQMVEIPAGQPLRIEISALGSGIQTFWSHWTGRHPHGSAGRDEETQD